MQPQLDLFKGVYDLFTPKPTTRDNYYNTVGLKGKELQSREMKTEAQGRKILDFFRSHPGELFTPFDVQRKLYMNHAPITSIRRSMTNLTRCKEAYLVKTDVKREGLYNDPNHCWVLNKDDSGTYSMTI